MASATLAFSILARDNASKTFDGVGSASSRLGSSLAKTALKFGAIVGAAALAGKAVHSFGQFLGDSIAEAREAEKVGKTTAQIIKSTGGATKVSAAQVGSLAESISNKSGIDDEAIQSGANLLLTFKNVKNEVGKGAKIFDRATAAAVDLSATGFGDVNSASKMLGKALNDPLKGLTALSKAGVTFTEGQKKQIETLMESGDVLGAQKIILGEVESQVGGVAAANATMGEKVRVAWANFKESVGEKLLPVLDKLGAWFIEKGIPALEQFAGWVENKAAPALGRMGDWVQANLMPQLRALGDWIMRDALPALSKFGDWFGANVLPKMMAFRDWMATSLFPALRKVHAELLPAVKKAWKDLTSGIKGADVNWRAIGTYITGTVIPILGKVAQVWLPVMVTQLKIVAAAVGIAWGAFTKWASVMVTVVSGLLSGFATISRGFATLLRALSHVPGFGWARDAANKMDGAADQASRLATNIRGITSKSVTVSVHYKATQSGRFNPAPTGYSPGRAAGGPVVRGMSYLVGENGPEMFTASSTGHITPARQTAETLSGGRRGDGSSGGGDDRPLMVQLMLDGRVIHEALVRRKRSTGMALGLA